MASRETGAESWWNVFFSERRKGESAFKLLLVVTLEVLGIVVSAAVAAVLRFGNSYLMAPDLDDLCQDSNYLRARRDAVIDIPAAAVAVIAVVAPPVLILFLDIAKESSKRLNAPEGQDGFRFSSLCQSYFNAMLVFFHGLFLTSALTDFLRLFFSRPKPYFLNTYNSYCTGGTPPDESNLSDNELDARLSFPSYSCTMLAFSGCVVAAHAELTLRSLRPGVCTLRPVLAIIAFLPSLVVASQAVFTRDNHWEDVAVGLLLGALLGGYLVLVLLREPRAAAPPPAVQPSQPLPQPIRLMELPRARIRTPSIEAINGIGSIPYMRQYSKKFDSDDSFY